MTLKNIINIFFVLFFSFDISLALTLEEAIKSGYESNSEFKIYQQTFLKDIEIFPKAIASGFLPNIAIDMSLNNNFYKEKFNNLTRKKTFQKQIVISQPIFTSGQATSNLLSAKAFYNYFKYQFYSNEQKSIFNFVKVFLDYYTAKEKYKLSENSLKFAEQQFEATRAKFKLGEVTKTDLAHAEANLSKAKLEKTKNFSLLEKNKMDFKNVLGIEIKEDLIFPELPKGLPKSADELISISSQFNFDINAHKALVKAKKFQKLVSIAGLLPKASINAVVGNNYPQYPISEKKNFYRSVSLSLHIPILTQGGTEYALIREAKKEAKKSEYALDNVINSVRSQAIFLWDSFNSLKTSLTYADAAVRAFDLTLNGIRQEYVYGGKTLLDVLAAEDKSYQSKIQQIETKKQIILTALEMRLIMGNLMAKNLNLKVKYFDPDVEFKKLKFIIGF